MNSAAVSNKSLAKRVKYILTTNWQLWILMLPAIAATFIFNYIPMYGIQIAFRNYKTKVGILGSQWVGLRFFQVFVTSPLFWVMLRNTLLISLFSLSLYPLNAIVALMIDELRSKKYKKTVQMISYAPHFMSTVIICSMIKLLFGRDNGIVNNIMAMFGMQRYEFLTSTSAFRPLLVLSGTWQNLGWNTIIYLAALSGVSMEQVEAAQIDGASRMKIVLHVKIPHILPTFIILFIMQTGSILSVGYEKVYLLQNDLNLEVSQIFSTYVYKIGIKNSDYSLSTAVDLFNCVANIIVLTTVNYISDRLSGVSIW